MPETRVSIVTPCYNSAATLGDTIASVLSQTYPHIEYIIMDGGSTDATAEVVARYADDPRLTFISEPDAGQSDAINKGWARATGDVLAWLCADDTYFPYTVGTAVRALTANPTAGWVYGYDRYADADGVSVPFNHHTAVWDYAAYRSQALYVSQPTVFWRRAVYDRFGPLRTDLEYMMDMEYFLRIGRAYPGFLVSKTLATVTWTRDTKTFSGGVARLDEMLAVLREYGGGAVAPTVRVQWADAHLAAAARHLVRLEWDLASASVMQAFRYPAHVPRGAAKLLVRWLLPAAAETRLRRALMGRRTA